MTYDKAFFDAGINRAGTRSNKWAAKNIMQEGMVPLWVADMDFACAEPIRQALVRRAEHACYGYTFFDESDFLAAAGFWKRRHQLDLMPDQMILLSTVVSGLRACIQTMTQNGDGVIIQTPVYGPFIRCVEESGRVVLDARLKHETGGRYTMDLDAVEDFLKKGARLMVLCSPHNPVGRCWTRDELRALLLLLNRYGAKLVSDEIHADFVYAPAVFVPVLSLDEAPIDTVSLISASKTFNIAGLKQAIAVCRDQETLEEISRYLERSGADCGNIFALEATRAAYNECDSWLDGVLSYLEGNQATLLELIEELLPHAVLSPMEATYLAWIDIRPYEIPQCEIGERCREHKVALSDGQFFGASAGEGFMRINYGCPRSQLLEGVHRFSHAIKGA